MSLSQTSPGQTASPTSEIKERRVVLVTGSGTGVGRACILQFAKLGFDVVVNYSRSDREARETSQAAAELGANTLCLKADVSEEAEVVEMVRKIEAEFGRLDVLVNNAARTFFIELNDLASLTAEKWDSLMQVNAKGPFLCTKHCAPLLKAHGCGSVVNVSSIAGTTGRGSSIAYAASKGALNTLTKSLAIALAPDIRVNAVLPGPIDSRWIREADNDWDLADMTAQLPIPKPSSPEDIADGVLFLATGSQMTTGQLLTIDGGMSL